MDSFLQLKTSFLNCQRCPALCQNRTQVVFGSGNPAAQVLFVGEAPGATEDTKGIPFCGMSGKILEELLATIGLTRDDIFITNTILCRPPDNRNPEKQEVENCRDRLDALIAIMKPTVIVTIGNFATNRILGKTGVTTIHGTVFPLSLHEQEVSVVPVIHPANYLYSGRNPELFAQMKADFAVISSLITQRRKQKKLGEF
ncbi:uracil-DNA glycosylase [Candidatus Woesearchaeota archaeon]|nr:uracil-DNA glycosylase [Candidatus Woesearchaeota archaeon]